MSPDPDGVERPHWDDLTPKQRSEMYALIEKYNAEHPFPELSDEVAERVGQLVDRFEHSRGRKEVA